MQGQLEAGPCGCVFPVADIIRIAERFHKGSGAKEKILGGRKETVRRLTGTAVVQIGRGCPGAQVRTRIPTGVMHPHGQPTP
jgi:hypothetical protein